MNVPMVNLPEYSKRSSHVASDTRAPSTHTRDRNALAQMGKKQVMKRKFGFLSILSFSCTVLATWERVLIFLTTGLTNGGTVGLIGQFIFVWGGTFCTFVTLGELASMAPTAGGQYHWVAILAPRSVRNFASYMTAWMTILAWIATIATGAFICATMIQGLCLLNWPVEYAASYSRYQGTLMTWAFVLVCVFFNTVIGSVLPQVEGMFLIVHVLGYFAILIPLTYYAPHGSVSQLFSKAEGYTNAGQWPTYGLSFMVGTLGAGFAFVGADAAVHMSEEISNAAINVPRSIVISIVINGSLGFGMLIAVIFCIGNQDTALQAQKRIGYNFIEIFESATASVGAATGMTSIVIVLACSATVGFLATGSRVIWAFARDNGLPFSNEISKVHFHAAIPVMAIAVASTIPCLLALINIASTVAFNDVTSLALVGFYSTYFICCAFLLHRRLTGGIMTAAPFDTPAPAYKNAETDEYVVTWGPWHVKGWLGTANNILSLCYLFTIWVFGFFPPLASPTARTMNYSSVVFTATVLFSVTYYVLWGRKQYRGPIVEIVL